MMFSTLGWAAGGTAPAAGGAVTLKLSSTSEPPAPKFNAAQLSRVGDWMRELAPSSPPAAVASATQHFLEELQWRQPDKMDHLLDGGVSAKDFESMLLRHLALQLTATSQAALRQELACLRVQTLLAPGGGTPAATPQVAAALLEKLKDKSQVYYQQLLEGHIDDDDLIPLLAEARRAGTPAGQPTPEKPRPLTAEDIMAAFSIHNQTNQAVEHLRAYKITGTLTEAGGAEQQILVFKLRPDRFRLHIVVKGATHYILSDYGTKAWQQLPGGKMQIVSLESLGPRRYLAEFVNPLFGEQENYVFERLKDSVMDGRKVYQIGVRRPDGSRYVSCIDPDTFHEVGQELSKDIMVRYSDFREVSGLTMAFREETTDAKGNKAVFVLNECDVNPGLIQDFFEPVLGHDSNFFVFEKLMAGTPAAAQP